MKLQGIAGELDAKDAAAQTREQPGASFRAANAASFATARVQVWDLPLRVFHWSLVIAVSIALVTGELGGSLMEVHAKAGLAIVGLVAFRLTWGLVGSTHARFLRFAPTPSRLRAYLQGRWHGVGHNPLGAFSVFALLGLLAVQATTGLFGNDDITFTGPLFELVEESFAGRLTTLHKQLANLLIGLVLLHLAAIVFYARVKRHNLVKPMVTGWTEVRAGTVEAEPVPARRGGGPLAFVLALALAVAVGAVWVANGSPWKAEAAATPAPAATDAPAAKPAW